ncbi:MAG: Asp-tRNA(Asn)/Glu-tRNA(Gln) amidotransferase subunit GatB [Candidatus Pacebacteria bacterium]|nr:Asp-tRNA(Asn)/Glu-tRNA(Gln) amidotransferase subunit GatB [Candidatus Paceibacterota bacterium]
MKYIPTIGLEIHAELRTKSKMFCSCANDTDQEKPNVNICPVCMGHPGTLPVLNKQAIKHVILVGHALGGTIADYTEWDRKNYFYPDIPKGYQISQYKYPLIAGGAVPVSIAGAIAGAEPRKVALTRIHLEEDTAKSTHDAHKDADGTEFSFVDFNRAGVPLLELVTEPVIHDAETAGAFAREFQLLLRSLGVANANMEKGEMRVEANVSVASEEDTAARKFGTKTEVKNLNSFRSVERAIAFEVERQSELLEKGEAVVQETRGWDENAGKTFLQRKKESSHDYRYFPDPDLPKLVISEIPEFSAENIKKGMPELPWEKRERLVKDFNMTAKEVAVFVDAPEVGAYFEKVIGGAASDISRLAINYILSDYLGALKKDHGEAFEGHLDTIEPAQFSALMKLIAGNKVSSRGAKDLLVLIYKGDKREPLAIAEEKGLLQKSNAGELESMAKDIIAKNQSVVADYKAGKLVALQFLIGQGMKLSKGSANPAVLRGVFLKELK